MVVRQRLVPTLSLLGFAALMLTQFQNCAAPNQLSSENDPASIQLVDDYNKAQIRFGGSDIQVGEVSSMAEINGQCQHKFNGSKINWSIWSESGEPVVSGESECKGGQFHVRLEDLEQFACGEGHQLAVEAVGVGTASIRFSRRCPPIASKAIDVQSEAPLGTRCALEYSPVSLLERKNACSKVCYRENVLMSQTLEEDATCKAMMSNLAGP